MGIDEVDVKILRALIKDARTSLKDMAKECNISSVAVLKRVNRLKTEGVISGSTVVHDLEAFGYAYAVGVGVNLHEDQADEVAKLIQEQVKVVNISRSFGKYDLWVYAFTKNLHELDNLTQAIRKHSAVSKIAINIWASEPHLFLENLDLQPVGVC